jgi:mRNA interferase MazF
MINLQQGRIIDVNLEPIKGSETGKVRPCIIVTNNRYNQRVPVIQVVPITNWTEKKAKIKTNVEILPSSLNQLTKKALADCLQTRPIDYQRRLVAYRGTLEDELLIKIDLALKIVFDLKD